MEKENILEKKKQPFHVKSPYNKKEFLKILLEKKEWLAFSLDSESFIVSVWLRTEERSHIKVDPRAFECGTQGYLKKQKDEFQFIYTDCIGFKKKFRELHLDKSFFEQSIIDYFK